MDQLKLLNFHKMIANFANNLVGAFVPLIIFQATKSLSLAFIYLVCNNIIRLLFTLSFRKLYTKIPQLMLLLRIIPILLYNIFIFILNVNLIVGVIGVCIFLALDYAFNNLAKETIFNYSSLSNQNSEKSSIGVTRLFEQIGIIVALLIGGYLLDIDKKIVLIMSLCIYAVSVIPLLMYYLKCRKQKTFNKDATSNAVATFKKDERINLVRKRLTKKLLITYGIVYFSFAFVDLLQTSYSLFVFNKVGEFATAGILNAVFNCFYAIGFYVAGVLNNKKDITKLVLVFCVLIGGAIMALPFIDMTGNLFILVCIIYGFVGLCYPFLSLFVLERMLLKSRIMGCSNNALFARETGCVSAYIVGYSFGIIGLIAIFIAMCVTTALSSIVIGYGEEKSRQNLVDFLQNNEIVNQKKHKKKA